MSAREPTRSVQPKLADPAVPAPRAAELTGKFHCENRPGHKVHLTSCGSWLCFTHQTCCGGIPFWGWIYADCGGGKFWQVNVFPFSIFAQDEDTLIFSCCGSTKGDKFVREK